MYESKTPKYVYMLVKHDLRKIFDTLLGPDGLTGEPFGENRRANHLPCFLRLPVTAFATTLRLSNEVDLLVLDGKRYPAFITRCRELISGKRPHQLVFPGGKPSACPVAQQRLYISPPLVISFSDVPTDKVRSISSSRGWKNEREASHFNAAPRSALDGDAMPIPKPRYSAITSTAKVVDYEIETERYNKSAKRASLPQFATMMADDSTLLSDVSELIPPHRRNHKL